MIFTYQLFHNGVDVDPEDFFCLASDCTTMGYPSKVVALSALRHFQTFTLMQSAVGTVVIDLFIKYKIKCRDE